MTCISGNYNFLKRKIELSQIQRKKINFINRLQVCRAKNLLYYYRCIL